MRRHKKSLFIKNAKRIRGGVETDELINVNIYDLLKKSKVSKNEIEESINKRLTYIKFIISIIEDVSERNKVLSKIYNRVVELFTLDVNQLINNPRYNDDKELAEYIIKGINNLIYLADQRISKIGTDRKKIDEDIEKRDIYKELKKDIEKLVNHEKKFLEKFEEYKSLKETFPRIRDKLNEEIKKIDNKIKEQQQQQESDEQKKKELEEQKKKELENYPIIINVLYSDYVKKYPVDKKNENQQKQYNEITKEMKNKRTSTDEKLITEMFDYLINYLPVQKNKNRKPSHANKFIDKIPKDKKINEKEAKELIKQALIDANINPNFAKSSIKNILMMISLVILGVILLVTGLYFVGVLVAYIMASKRYTHEETKNKAIYSWLFVFINIS